MAETVDLSFLAKLSQQIISELGALRREVGEVRSLALGTVDYVRRVDQRIADSDRRSTELRDDIELMVKAELGGRFAHFEAQVEHTLGSIQDRLASLETR